MDNPPSQNNNSGVFSIMVGILLQVGSIVTMFLGFSKSNEELAQIRQKAQGETYVTEQHRQEMFFKMYDKMAEVRKSGSDNEKKTFQKVIKAMSDLQSNSNSAHNYLSVFLVAMSSDTGFPREVRSDASLALEQVSNLPVQVLATAFDSATATRQDLASSRFNSMTIVNRKLYHPNFVDVDVFYLSDNTPADTSRLKNAQAIASLLANNNYNAKLRPLLDAVNNRPGYGVKTNQIRYNPQDPNENAIKEKIVGVLGTNYALQPTIVPDKTPWYVSIFIVK